jgi:Na+-transporting NADH:ubiquinone oxidoreductase subunit D
LLGYEILPLVQNDGWYVPNQMMLLPPSTFFIIGFLIWAIRKRNPDQVEEPDFEEVKVRDSEQAA